MNRDTLAAQVDAHLNEQETRLRQAFNNGRRFERERQHKVEWRKLITVVVSGSFVGCGIALAVAIWLSTL